jgi:cytochrome d ubiquinol oxidase subunit I
VSGALSGIFVVIANAWMNTPTGFTLVDGRFTDIDPVAAMRNPAAFQQTLHMTLAAYAATGFAVAGIHAARLLRHPELRFHRHALVIALTIAIPAALLQPISGDISARNVARWQPAKFAAMEGHFATEAGAPLVIGGWPDVERRETRWALEIPNGLSLLAHHDPDAVVTGLDAFPPDEWPPVPIVHIAFQVMVGLGTVMVAISLWSLIALWRRRPLERERWLLRSLVLAAPMGFIAIEAGWTVTEVGRQPWIVYGIIRTADAVTPMPGLVVPFVLFTLLYVFLAVIVVALLRRQILHADRDLAPPAPSSSA